MAYVSAYLEKRGLKLLSFELQEGDPAGLSAPIRPLSKHSSREMEWQQVVITDNNLMKQGDRRSSESHLVGKRLQAAPFVVFFSRAVTKMHTIHNMEVKRKIIGHE